MMKESAVFPGTITAKDYTCVLHGERFRGAFGE
jgi:hypothetical protein